MAEILIVDFGSQYTQLIARRVRESHIYCRILGLHQTPSAHDLKQLQGIILSGGPESVSAAASPRIPEYVFELDVPVLGICYGMQALVEQLGGRVAKAEKKEFGRTPISLEKHDIFHNIAKALTVWMSHGDHVTHMPSGFSCIARSENTPVAAIAHENGKYFGFQFHPEVTHTEEGQALLKNFLFRICHCEPTWTSESIVESALASIRDTVGKEKVLLGLSGGVDSSVVAALLHRAIGRQLVCVFVDTGLLRAGEADEVMHTFRDAFHMQVIRVNARDLFYKKLKGVKDPEQKRKIIGRLFVRLFEKEAKRLPGVAWLAQGTIYPDVIESAAEESTSSHMIKSHHNVGGLPSRMKLKLLEPLRELFKDEVRQVGAQLNLPAAMVHRHPFPGPGLGVRILGPVTPEFVAILQKADKIFIDALRAENLYDAVAQAFAVFLPVKSVGVKGDARSYDYVIALRAVTTTDFMTAKWAHLPADLLSTVSEKIMNEVAGVSRVVYDVSSKPPSTIEWE